MIGKASVYDKCITKGKKTWLKMVQTASSKSLRIGLLHIHVTKGCIQSKKKKAKSYAG
jgi:hypothetical protein